MRKFTKYLYTALLLIMSISCERGSRPITESGHLTIELTNADENLLRVSQQQNGLSVICDHSDELRLKANIASASYDSIKMEVRYNDNLPATVSEGSNCRLSAVVDTTHEKFSDFKWKDGSKGILYQTVFSEVSDAKITLSAIEGFQSTSSNDGKGNGSELDQNIQKIDLDISTLDAAEVSDHKYFMSCNNGETFLNPDKVQIEEGLAKLEFILKPEQVGIQCDQIQIFADKELSKVIATTELSDISIPTSSTLTDLSVTLTSPSTSSNNTELSRTISGPWFARVSVSNSDDTFVVYSPNNKSDKTEIKLDTIKGDLTAENSELQLFKVSSISELKNRAIPSINALLSTLAISKENIANYEFESIHQVYSYELREMNTAELEAGHSFISLQWFGVVGSNETSTGFYYDLIFHPNNSKMLSTGDASYISDEDLQQNLALDASLNVIGKRWNDSNFGAENSCDVEWAFADFQIEADFMDANYDWETLANPAESSCELDDDDFFDIAFDAEINVATIYAWTWQKVSP